MQSHVLLFLNRRSSDLLAISIKSDNWHISISEDMIKWKQNTMEANAACYLTTCHDSTEDIWLYYTFGLLVKWIRTQLATIAPHGNIKSIRSKSSYKPQENILFVNHQHRPELKNFHARDMQIFMMAFYCMKYLDFQILIPP